MINAGKYNKQITIYQVVKSTDADGFPVETEVEVLKPYANVRTTKGFTLIANNSDFEKAYTNFTIRYPVTEITRDMLINFKGKTYTIEYLNNVDEANIELEIQAKEVTH
jgi:SPP1 family predicted phage head-tail adaptor